MTGASKLLAKGGICGIFGITIGAELPNGTISDFLGTPNTIENLDRCLVDYPNPLNAQKACASKVKGTIPLPVGGETMSRADSDAFRMNLPASYLADYQVHEMEIRFIWYDYEGAEPDWEKSETAVASGPEPEGVIPAAVRDIPWCEKGVEEACIGWTFAEKWASGYRF